MKSEVCYAGAGYCLALACFATENSKEYLKKYLEYYLERKDLWFDQAAAFCALEYLDKKASNQLMNKWQDFIYDKPNWDLKRSREHFVKGLDAIEKIKQFISQS